jgi:RNA polymerase sigma factor (sigma-70 family)
MATAQLGTVRRHLHRLAAESGRQRTDRQLLDQFAAYGDESAFHELVTRHGPMVLRVCRRVLKHEQDAEDAFQATFLVLARSTRSIQRQDALASWLHGVAYRTAMKARRSAARRRSHEAHLHDVTPRRAEGPTWDEVQGVLDEEVERLPAAYRAAFVLCVVQGKSGPEVAAELGVKPGTVWSRLTRARCLLQRRLTRRGIELAALLSALSVAASSGRSAVPAALAQATIRFGLAVAAGASAAGQVPPHIAALAEGVTGAMFLTKTKIAVALLLAAGVLIAGAAAVARETSPPKTEAASPPLQVAVATEGARPAPKEDREKVRYAGHVLGADGKPVAGARLYLLYATSRPLNVLATSDEKGQFDITLARDDFDRSSLAAPWENAEVIAVAEGHGLGLVKSVRGNPAPRTDLTVRLARDDAPLTGRIVDLEGKPIAGVTVRVQGVVAPSAGDLDAFVKALEDKELFPAIFQHTFGPLKGREGRNLGSPFPTVTTGADGRFAIRGIGRERLAALRIEGPTIVTRDVYAMTRAAKAQQLPGYKRYLPRTDLFSIYGNGLEHVAAPCRPIVGVVRDKDTGKPIPGAVITSFRRAGSHISAVTDLQTVADREGRYRLLGMPKGEGNVIRAGPPEREPYLMAVQQVDDPPGVEPVTANFALKRGVWLTGRVLDQATGAPLHAQVEYVIFEDNPYRKEAQNLSVEMYLQSNARDGTFRTVALPGRGLLGARAWGDNYRFGAGADTIKGLEPNGHFLTYPHLLFAEGYNRLVEVNPAADAKEVTCDLLLDPGRTVKGTVLGPDGKPLAGVRVSGLRAYGGYGQWEHKPLPTSDFLVTGLDREQTRLLQFTHAEKKLAGHFVVKGKDSGPVQVKLIAAGTLTGRLVTPDGVAVSEGRLASLRGPIDEPDRVKENSTIGLLPADISPGKDGKFRIEGAIPGLTYHLGLIRGMYLHRLGGAAAGKVSVKPGETKDLGDVVVQPIE